MDYGAIRRETVADRRVRRGGVAAEREREREREKGRRVDATHTLRCCAG